MTAFAVEPVTQTSRLATNLAVLARRDPALAERLARTPSRAGLQISPSEQEGFPTAELNGVALASRRRPWEEGERLAGSFDLRKSGGLLVLGFGLGYHVAAASHRLKRAGVVVVFEPDLGLLRSVFEEVDHTTWMSQYPFLFITDPDNAGAMSEMIRGCEAPLALGIEILEHPASRQRLGDQGKRFTDAFSRVVGAMRTHVITTMVQTDVTVRNVLMNADAYVSEPGIDDLAGACAGGSAVVVAAGPSLQRTIDALAEPGVRDRCVIIAVQTVVKQLLAKGIRPHFVTALDYHEISRRFYEGLTASDVEGVTLIAEPKANPAIVDAWPGAVRLCGDRWLDDILGPEIAGTHAALSPGATVAHLAYYFARHLGCDPVILTGQDLAFTDGQYYAKGAAIHRVWSGELSDFNTLEMMEWQRIVRMRGNLHKVEDHLGRPAYTDDQMATYLAQFERDFGNDVQHGLTVIDATEGGVRKAHTSVMPLREAILRFGRPHRLPDSAGVPRTVDTTRTTKAAKRLIALQGDARRIARLSRETIELLRKMNREHGNEARVNRIIKDVYRLRDEVQGLRPAYDLVQRLNQTGSFKRYRADRELLLTEAITPLDRQKKQIERDITNVRWIVDVADVFEDVLGAAAQSVVGKAPKRTRDAVVSEEAIGASDSDGNTKQKTRVGAMVVLADPASVSASFQGQSILRFTLERLAKCRTLDSIAVVTDTPDKVRSITQGLKIDVIVADLAEARERRCRVMAARRWSASSWRGGISHLTCYDEVFDAPVMAELLAKHGLDAALVVGGDWCFVDPALCDAVIERFTESPTANMLTFTQAPPGLAGCVIDRRVVEDLARGRANGATFASIGGLLGYIPTAARHDPIAKPCCVQISPEVRDTLVRFVPDSPHVREGLEHALASRKGSIGEVTSGELASIFAGLVAWPSTPVHLIVELNTERAAQNGLRDRWMAPSGWGVRAPMTPDVLRRSVDGLMQRAGSAPRITLSGMGDPLLHPQWGAIVESLASLGVAGIHLRTDLITEPAVVSGLLTLPIDVISIDMWAHTPETYARMTGGDHHRQLLGNLELLLKGRSVSDALPTPWVVPRITRCDAVYAELESCYDTWLMFAGAAVIDPLPHECPGDRIVPFDRPANVVDRDRREQIVIRCDGSVMIDDRTTASIAHESLPEIWQRLAPTRPIQ